LQPLLPKPVALLGVVVVKVQHPAFGLIEAPTVDLSPLLQPVQVSLQSLPTLEQINTPTQLGVICKLTEGLALVLGLGLELGLLLWLGLVLGL
ncbi:unnamed protein product, partial [Bubo scandiacus]